VKQIAFLFFVVPTFTNKSWFSAIRVGANNKTSFSIDALWPKGFKLRSHDENFDRNKL